MANYTNVLKSFEMTSNSKHRKTENTERSQLTFKVNNRNARKSVKYVQS